MLIQRRLLYSTQCSTLSYEHAHTNCMCVLRSIRYVPYQLFSSMLPKLIDALPNTWESLVYSNNTKQKWFLLHEQWSQLGHRFTGFTQMFYMTYVTGLIQSKLFILATVLCGLRIFNMLMVFKYIHKLFLIFNLFFSNLLLRAGKWAVPFVWLLIREYKSLYICYVGTLYVPVYRHFYM